ncbi:replication initiator [Streptomyces lasiicapitis]|uniref:Plasmid replication initiator protein n=1 Tax=Streptomyces lasiicapitis TaxID=1923961 RepID=A0ABQ2MCY2_9ACTN|nr:replication initiator [Streptomyces lasiicapitis]GGO49687.1 plasmid replication initiator protein [Streptomyces lasiicapitis]
MSAEFGINSRPEPALQRSATALSRSAELAREQRLQALSEEDRDLIRLVHEPYFARWLEQIKAIGGCAHPVYLAGSTVTCEATSGEVLASYSTDQEPGERLALRCRNRRGSVCAPCSWLHAGDTYQLVRSGLVGGKSVPDAVRERPRLFVTLTAPGFGSVHRAADGERCRPRREDPRCEHGRPQGCDLAHTDRDSLVGLPLCVDCYDYVGHVLWHAHAGRLWDRFTTGVRRHLATVAGIPRSRLGAHVVVSFAKVAEYQQRAAVHFHAVVRLDGPAGPEDQPPEWATEELLAEAVTAAVGAASVRVPESDAYGTELLGFGAQLDVRPIRAFGDDQGLSDDAVAAYVAKYVTKGAADTGTGLDHAVSGLHEIRAAAVSGHVRALMGTCWRLGGLAELRHLRLRAWAHTLGYRGHVLTKSRRYSTTYTALRAQRADHQRGGPDPLDDPDTVTEASWRYVGSGYTPGAALLAASIAEELTQSRRLYAEALEDDRAYGREEMP